MSDADKLRQLKSDYQTYKISLAEAQKQAEPLLERMNIKRAELAKKYHQFFKPFTFEDFK